MNATLSEWLCARGYGAPERQQSVGGGCINEITRLWFDDDRRLILKHNERAPADLFAAEAAGLEALAQTRTLRMPAVLLVTGQLLLLEDLGSGRPRPGYWEQLGHGLAALHRQTRDRFGFTMNTYCGTTLQHNPASSNGHEFFAQQRLLPLAASAAQRGLLEQADLAALERVAHRLERWIPHMPATLIHGDLWSGNVHCDAEGGPALIDPACYWGWAEAELAMTLLFGGFDSSFYAAYQERSTLATDWRERAPLYNLYHLLNHLLLFGTGYREAIRRTLHRFG